MKEYRAKLSFSRIAPRKVRLVADLVRGRGVPQARRSLNFSTKRASKDILKLLNSAVANAKKENEGLSDMHLFIKEITVDEGPKLKRYRARARGSADEIHKKTSHINLVLAEVEKPAGSKKPKTTENKKTEKPAKPAKQAESKKEPAKETKKEKATTKTKK